MRIAIVGCGYVADFYMMTLANHASLVLAGVHDRDPERARHFASFHNTRDYGSLEALLADPTVDLVVNLTNPRSHYEVSRAAWRRGSTSTARSRWRRSGRRRSSWSRWRRRGASGSRPRRAPFSARRRRRSGARFARSGLAASDSSTPSWTTAWSTRNRTGWKSASGIPWPSKDEFEVGCTLEHAGYYVTWLAALFGPATSVTAFASAQIPDKGVSDLAPPDAADFSVGCIQFASGVAARLTCSIIAPTITRCGCSGTRGRSS